MKQHSLGLGVAAKQTRRREFLDEMEKVVPWADLVALVSPYLPEGKRGRPPFSPETMLRIHFMQQWFAMSDPAMAFVLANAAKYNIDPNRIFLAGDSAGAHIAAQLAIAISEPDYAKAINVKPVLPRHALRGLILDCGIYDPDGMKVDGPMAGFLSTVAWSYFDVKDLAMLPPQFSIVKNMTGTMPPIFVTAGNADPLLPHSKTLVDAASRLGVTVDALFFAGDHSPPLQHEYQFDLDTEAGREAMRRSLKFVADYEQ